MRTLAAILLCLFLAGCYETVGEKTDRERMERNIRDIERDRNR